MSLQSGIIGGIKKAALIPLPKMSTHYIDPTPIRVSNKSYLMFRRSEALDAVYYVRLQHGGKRYLKSTESCHKALAKERARGIIEAILGEKWDELSAVKSRKSAQEVDAERDVPTLGQVIELYLSGEESVRPVVARKNVACLKRIVKLVAGKKPVVETPVTSLTESLVKAFQAKVQGRASVSYQATLDANVYANSCYRQAKSIFSKSAMRKYGALNLPPMDEFMHVPFLKEPSQKYSDAPIPHDTIQAITAALPALKQYDERLWVIHLMIRLMGMRDSEIVRARKSWLIEKRVSGPGGVVPRWFLQIMAKEGEDAPKRQDGEISVPGELQDYFLKQEGVFLIPAKTETERRNLVERGHSQWLRKFLPDRTKTNHELRKHAGSVVATKTNSFEKAAQFLRIDIETAKRHYLSLLTPMQPLGMDDLSM